ncbi:MAG: hypothetical protein ACXVJ7_00065 [Acidimicrobiia bacterium]
MEPKQGREPVDPDEELVEATLDEMVEKVGDLVRDSGGGAA